MIGRAIELRIEKGAIGYNEENHCLAVMPHITLTEAQQHLPEIIVELTPGKTIQIFQDDRPIARLILESLTIQKPRKPGSGIGTFTIVNDDYWQDFGDYMP